MSNGMPILSEYEKDCRSETMSHRTCLYTAQYD